MILFHTFTFMVYGTILILYIAIFIQKVFPALMIGVDFIMLFSDKVITQISGLTKDQVEFFASSNVALAKSSYISPNEGIIHDFQFLIPLHNVPPILIDNKEHPLKTSIIFPSNPMQVHKAVDVNHSNYPFWALLIEKDFLKQTSKTLFNSESLEFENKSFSNTPQIKSLLNSFIEESRAGQPGHELFLQSLSVQISVAVLREGRHNHSGQITRKKIYSDYNCIKRAIEFLTANYDKNITLEELAREVNYSPYHFLRIFKSATGMTPSEYLLDIKTEKAKNLLCHTSYSITQICYLCGFSSSSYFNQAFKRKTGASPSSFRKNT